MINNKFNGEKVYVVIKLRICNNKDYGPEMASLYLTFHFGRGGGDRKSTGKKLYSLLYII
jgi:hypothetical protein